MRKVAGRGHNCFAERARNGFAAVNRVEGAYESQFNSELEEKRVHVSIMLCAPNVLSLKHFRLEMSCYNRGSGVACGDSERLCADRRTTGNGTYTSLTLELRPTVSRVVHALKYRALGKEHSIASLALVSWAPVVKCLHMLDIS